MRASSLSITVVLFVLAAFGVHLFIAPSCAEAKYNYDPPPDEETNLTPYIIIGVVAVTAVVIYWMVTRDGKDEDADDESKVGLMAEADDRPMQLLSRSLVTRNPGDLAPIQAGAVVANPYFDLSAGDDRPEPMIDIRSLMFRTRIASSF